MTQHTADLTRLGSVELVIADPVPRTELLPTRDADHLKGVLSQMALRLSPGQGKPNRQLELLAMRAEFLAEALHPTPAVDPEEFARWVVTEELRLAQQWQDHLLDALIERAGASARRVVFLVSSGYDLYPGDFYLSAVGLGSEGSAVNLTGPAQDLAKTLSAYGWVVVPVVPPPPDPEIRKGKRIGKFRLEPFRASREAERDEGKAEGYLELGLALKQQGKLEDAEDAFKKALHHFYGDPRTAERQALASLELGAIREQLGKTELAARAYAEARELSPELATERLGPLVELLDPTAPLVLMARTTTGALVRNGKDVGKAVENLGDRVRLTYQVPGFATGRLHPVSISYKRSGNELSSPRWARSATPEPVAALRARRMLAGAMPEGELEVKVILDPSFEFPDDEGDRGGGVTIRVESADTGAGDAEALLRVSVAAGAPNVLARVWHDVPQAVAPGNLIGWSQRRHVELSPDDSLVTVLVEDLYSGRRGTAVVSVKDPDRDDEYP